MPEENLPIDQYRPQRPRWPAMAVSLALHGLAIASLAWLLRERVGQGTTTATPPRSVAMAIVHRMPDRTRYITEPREMTRESETARRSESITPDAKPAPQQPLLPRPPIDLSEILAEMAGDAPAAEYFNGGVAGGPENPSDAAADSLVSGRVRMADGRSLDQLGDAELVPGVTRSGRGAGQTTTELFGVSGSGSTFVYVFDRSESMSLASSAPLRAAKTELIRSLETLTDKQQFQIIFYNDQPDVFRSDGERTGLVIAEPATIDRAKKYVEQTVAIGGTEHEAALKMALRMAPDVIFFLTDAKIQTMSAAQLDEITRRAQDAGTTIHAIQFGTGPAVENSFLEQLARKIGGGYRYVDVTSLK